MRGRYVCRTVGIVGVWGLSILFCLWRSGSSAFVAAVRTLSTALHHLSHVVVNVWRTIL